MTILFLEGDSTRDACQHPTWEMRGSSRPIRVDFNKTEEHDQYIVSTCLHVGLLTKQSETSKRAEERLLQRDIKGEWKRQQLTNNESQKLMLAVCSTTTNRQNINHSLRGLPRAL